jgi:hypothetical protein
MRQMRDGRAGHARQDRWQITMDGDEFVFSVPRLEEQSPIPTFAAPAAPGATAAHALSANAIDRPQKIGIGTWEIDALGTALSDIEALDFGWYYNWQSRRLWHPDGLPDDNVEFVPMFWGADDVRKNAIDRIGQSDAGYVLGFNEPDLVGQAEMTVDEAIDLWPSLMKTGKRLGSPAPTWGEVVGETSWLGRFMDEAEKRDYRVDFIALHYYSDNADVSEFKAFLQSAHQAYHKPIWVTEWALVDWLEPHKFSVSEIAAFAEEAIRMMDDLRFVKRHAWFAAYDGGGPLDVDTELFDKNGDLTAVGEVFAEFLM